uniref:Uncharacterized protein n=1 Tax=Chromera velia CCMP2878 TaxID=1169474 RepID=A0A0G4HMB0_9ALVE|eukprot:Cvel_29008.t1-p1 / transcript=Cvel_29008.t1 / gene=Cvel_29008 / organism=Chromera_velia_CCMP2878 / gene_product=hypothetical protein / transcript_product=hypothetical protein / location=Cvel_scaffold3907:7285-9818(-) / protein_length=640 / sequence_SO=supercontig / SO=protein_coding / is_pseudo=false
MRSSRSNHTDPVEADFQRSSLQQRLSKLASNASGEGGPGGRGGETDTEVLGTVANFRRRSSVRLPPVEKCAREASFVGSGNPSTCKMGSRRHSQALFEDRQAAGLVDKILKQCMEEKVKDLAEKLSSKPNFLRMKRLYCMEQFVQEIEASEAAAAASEVDFDDEHTKRRGRRKGRSRIGPSSVCVLSSERGEGKALLTELRQTDLSDPAGVSRNFSILAEDVKTTEREKESPQQQETFCDVRESISWMPHSTQVEPASCLQRRRSHLRLHSDPRSETPRCPKPPSFPSSPSCSASASPFLPGLARGPSGRPLVSSMAQSVTLSQCTPSTGTGTGPDGGQAFPFLSPEVRGGGRKGPQFKRDSFQVRGGSGDEEGAESGHESKRSHGVPMHLSRLHGEGEGESPATFSPTVPRTPASTCSIGSARFRASRFSPSSHRRGTSQSVTHCMLQIQRESPLRPSLETQGSTDRQGNRRESEKVRGATSEERQEAIHDSNRHSASRPRTKMFEGASKSRSRSTPLNPPASGIHSCDEAADSKQTANVGGQADGVAVEEKKKERQKERTKQKELPDIALPWGPPLGALADSGPPSRSVSEDSPCSNWRRGRHMTEPPKSIGDRYGWEAMQLQQQFANLGALNAQKFV